MAERELQSRQAQAQLQAVAIEIKNIRDEYHSTLDHHHRLCGLVIQNTTRLENLTQHLRDAETRQRQHLQRLNSALSQPIGSGRRQLGYGDGASVLATVLRSDCGYETNATLETRSGLVSSLMATRSASGPSAAFSSEHSEVFNSISPQQRGDADSIPPVRSSSLRLPRTQVRDHSRALRLRGCTIRARRQPEFQTAVGSTENAVYLPMAMENILAERKRYELQDTLKTW